MSLLDEAMEKFVFQDKTTVPDGYGGYVVQYTNGAPITAACVENQSSEMILAQAMGAKSIYTITTRKNINLQYHDVLKRVRDGKIFRITSDGDDKATPKSATLNMRNVTAEEFILPS